MAAAGAAASTSAASVAAAACARRIGMWLPPAPLACVQHAELRARPPQQPPTPSCPPVQGISGNNRHAMQGDILTDPRYVPPMFRCLPRSACWRALAAAVCTTSLSPRLHLSLPTGQMSRRLLPNLPSLQQSAAGRVYCVCALV